MEEIAKDAGIGLSEMTLFYYEVYEQEFDESLNEWATLLAAARNASAA
jgi:hypothetical protein